MGPTSRREGKKKNLTRPLKQAYEDAPWLFGQVSHENMFMGVLGCFSFRHVHFKWGEIQVVAGSV